MRLPFDISYRVRVRACLWLGGLMAALPTVLAWPAAHAAAEEAVRVATVERETPAGPIRGLAVAIDLTDPRIDVVVTGKLDPARTPDRPLDPNAEAILTPTDDFAQAHGLAIAVNANFFSWLGDKKTTVSSDIIGLNVSDGVVVSTPREHDGLGDPALVFLPDRTARIDRVTHAKLDQWKVVNGVAGIGGGESDATEGTLLVDDGRNLGASARVAPDRRHPRTAAGVSEDGRTLYLLVIDGRRLGHSVGVTLPELADLMIEMGAHDALNLDGGGSSAIVIDPALAPAIDPAADGIDDGFISNRPSDGRFRAVGNNLGIRLRDTHTP